MRKSFVFMLIALFFLGSCDSEVGLVNESNDGNLQDHLSDRSIMPFQIFTEIPTASIFQFFKLNPKKLKSNTKQLLAKELAPVVPVYLITDSNQTPIAVPGATFRTNEMYSYYGTGGFKVFKSVDRDVNRAVEQRCLVNFKLPEGTAPGDTNGKVVHVNFASPVNYFGGWFSGDPVFEESGGLTHLVQFQINGEVVAEQDISNGLPVFIGVQMENPFTEITIVPIGGLTSAYHFDRPSFK